MSSRDEAIKKLRGILEHLKSVDGDVEVEMHEVDLSKQKPKRPRQQPAPTTPLAKAAQAELLKERVAAFMTHHAFKPGDLVEYKPGLEGTTKDFGCYVVIELLPEPYIHTGAEEGTPRFLQRYDIRLGTIDPDGDFMIFSYDSREFQPYTGPTSETL